MPTPGAPYIIVPNVRSWDQVPISFDWHDFLINVRQPGGAVALNDTIRPPRAQATGMQLICTQAGVSSAATSIQWPLKVGAMVNDGTVIWTSEPCDDTSMRTDIASHTFDPDSPVVCTDLGTYDYVISCRIADGVSANTYDVRCRIVCVNGDNKEAVAVVTVQD